MKKQTFQFLVDELASIKEWVKKDTDTTNRLESNWDKDRQDFTDFKNRLNHLETQFVSLEETISKIPNLIRDRVAEAIEPSRQESHDLKQAIMGKRMVALDSQVIKSQNKAWWKFWKN